MKKETKLPHETTDYIGTKHEAMQKRAPFSRICGVDLTRYLNPLRFKGTFPFPI